jgi:hypothetical protein
VDMRPTDPGRMEIRCADRSAMSGLSSDPAHALGRAASLIVYTNSVDGLRARAKIAG